MDDHFPYRIGSEWDHEVRSPAHPYLDDPPGAYMGRKRPRWESWDRDRDSGGRGRDIQRRMEPRDDDRPRHHHQEYHRREQARLEASFGMSSISPPVVSRSDYVSNRGGEAPPLFEPFNRGRGGGVGDFPHFEPFNRERGSGSGSGVGDLPEFEPFNRGRGGRGGGVGDLPEFEPFNRGRESGSGSGSGVRDLPEFEPFNRGRGGGVGDLSEFEPFNRGRGGEDTLQFEQFTPNRGRGGEDHLGAEQRLTPPPSLFTADYSRSTMEVNEETLDNRGYAENNLLGSRGKRVPSGTPKKEKPNVASRIQSGKSVWERIEERPAFLPYTGDHQLESDALDLSFNSDAFMAKVVESSVPVGPSSEVKVIPALNPTGIKKKIKKKKDVMNRTRVVIPIVTTSKSPTSAKGAQGATAVGKSSEIIALSGKTVTNGIPQSCLKTPLKTASGSVGKKAARKSAKTVVMKEDGVTVDASAEDAKVKEESRKYADALLSEISTQLFQHGSLVVATPKEKSAGEQSEEPGRSARTGDVKDISEERFVTPDGKPGSNCVDPVCSVTGVVDNDTSKISDQTGDLAVTSNEASTAGGSCKAIDLVDNEVAVEYVERSPQTREITVCTELSLSPAYEAQVEMPFGSVIFPGSCSTPKGKRGKRKREVEEKHQQFATGKVSVLSDSSFDLNVNGTATVLTAEMMDVVLDQRQHDGPKDDEDNGIDLQVSNEPKSGYARLGPDYLGVSMIDSVVKQKVDSLTAVFKVQEHSFDTQNNLPFNSSFVSEENMEVRSNKFMPPQLLPKVQSLLPCQPKKQMFVDKKIVGQEPVRKTNAASGVTRAVPIRVTSAGPTKVPTRSSHSVRNKTWHRNETPSSESVSHGILEGPGEQSQKKFGRPPNSYIRKGNSLIRKPAPDVHPPKQAYDLDISSKTNRDAMKRSICDEIEVKKTDTTIISNLPFERPKTPPLPPGTKLTNCTMNLPSEYPYPMSEEPNPEIDAQTRLVQAENQAIDLLSGTPENQNITSGRKSEPSNLKKMVYVKPKSNQLVAAPRPEACTQILASFPSSDRYYRKKKNQLVRNASKTDIRQIQNAVSSFGNSISDNQRISTVSNMKRSTATKFMKRLDKVLQKTYKHPKCSLVWTLSGEMPNAKGVSSSNRLKVLPHLLPWKRTIYSRNFNRNNTTVPRRSLSLFSKKLQHTRIRNTIYKVSTDGFSLRKAGVVSIGGSSLKWSKSIEKHSKKASKEATLAVAEAERKKRETHVTTSVSAKGKSGRALPRERIFRIGSARYKMEASRRSLVRIPDERSSSAVDLKSGNNSQTPFVPRRLLIGNDEYIHVGNGNKLVRDPKKLVRILATEKVRWSLHTARLRLAKKQQYCQFFTRFGKCNKNGGKCPYIHDPAKIAICTKFVRGLCSNTNCKLTHKVLPERMPDCSYYLQALCTNINCPYRHVHVNPKASVCEDFLKGYCADGDECLKKHSYVCPPFEAAGKCLEGSKCKLHHPKPKNKPKKKKVPKVQSSSHRRYFGSSVLEAGEPLIAASDQHVMENVGDFFYSDGQCTDYIPLDIGSEGEVEVDDQMDFEQIPCDSELSDMQENDLDALIKPVLIMKANLTNPCG